jgi:hypothetical protein
MCLSGVIGDRPTTQARKVAKQRNSKNPRPAGNETDTRSSPGESPPTIAVCQFIVGHRFLSVIVGVDLESW